MRRRSDAETSGALWQATAHAATEDGATTARPRGRHARHAASIPHGTSASVTGAFQRLDPSVTGSFAALTSADFHPIAAPVAPGGGGPRPIGVDPAVTGSFERIAPNTGAHLPAGGAAVGATGAHASLGAARRMRRADRPSVTSHATPTVPRNRRATAAIAVAAVAVVIGVATLLHHALTSAVGTLHHNNDPATQAAPADGIAIAGTTYRLVNNDNGTFALYARAGEGKDVAVALLNGTPAQLIAYNGAVIVPESYPDGTWDVIAYTPGGDAVAAQVVDGEGVPVHGSGSVEDARLDGDTLVIVDSSGATTSISLRG